MLTPGPDTHAPMSSRGFRKLSPIKPSTKIFQGACPPTSSLGSVTSPAIVSLASHQKPAAINSSPGLSGCCSINAFSTAGFAVVPDTVVSLLSMSGFPSWVPMSVKTNVNSLILQQVKGLLSTLSAI